MRDRTTLRFFAAIFMQAIPLKTECCLKEGTLLSLHHPFFSLYSGIRILRYVETCSGTIDYLKYPKPRGFWFFFTGKKNIKKLSLLNKNKV